MKNRMAVAVSVLVAAGCACAAAAAGAEASVGVDLANAYIFRGVTFNDGLVVQPGLEVGGMPVTLGVWGNLDLDDYDGSLEEGEFSEIDLYASYELPLDMERVAVSVGYTEYLYPGFGGAELGTDGSNTVAEATQGEADREVSMSVGLDCLLSPSLDVYYGLAGGLEKSLYIELGVSHAVEVNDELGASFAAGVAYSAPDEGEEGFSHWTVAGGLDYEVLSASVAYIGQIDDDVLPDAANGESGYDVEVLATLGVAYDF